MYVYQLLLGGLIVVWFLYCHKPDCRLTSALIDEILFHYSHILSKFEKLLIIKGNKAKNNIYGQI